MRGDCLSAILFIFYLARALSVSDIQKEHSYAESPEQEIKLNIKDDHNYHHHKEKYFMCDPKYADDNTHVHLFTSSGSKD